MARSKPPRPLKIRAPRHNSQRLGPALTSAVQSVCRQDNVIVHLPPPVQEQPSSAGPSSENASEWNSLLITARAQRGPQWDVGTQQFLVEKESELYYDPTPLLEAARTVTGSSSGQGEASGQQHRPQQPHDMGPSGAGIPLMHQPVHPHQRSPYPHPQSSYPYPGEGMAHGTPVRQMSGFPGSPMSAGPPSGGLGMGGGMVASGSFYNDAMTPTRPGPGGMMNGGPTTPDMYGRRMTRQMSDGYFGN